jgi:hypothetical protein
MISEQLQQEGDLREDIRAMTSNNKKSWIETVTMM